MAKNRFTKHWVSVGEFVAKGGSLGFSDLVAIYDTLRLSEFDDAYLPHENLIEGSVQERKDSIFELAEKIWKIKPGEWLKMEKNWLDESRIVSGSPEKGGKDKIADVVSAEILLRLVAAARYVVETDDGRDAIDEAIDAINIILAEVCAKGRTRMMRKNGHSVYANMKKSGIMIGTGGGKYLPYPQKSLPQLLLLMLDVKQINFDVYGFDEEEKEELDQQMS